MPINIGKKYIEDKVKRVERKPESDILFVRKRKRINS